MKQRLIRFDRANPPKAFQGVAIALVTAGLLVVYMAVGVMESVMARYRMDRVPKFILTSFALAFFATVITLEFIK